MSKFKSRKLDPNRVRERMAVMGMAKAADLARAVPCDDGPVANWLKGKFSPSGDYLLRLAEVLGSSPQYLCGTETTLDDARERIVSELKSVGGGPEAEILGLLAGLPESDRREVAAMVEGRTAKVRHPAADDKSLAVARAMAEAGKAAAAESAARRKERPAPKPEYPDPLEVPDIISGGVSYLTGSFREAEIMKREAAKAGAAAPRGEQHAEPAPRASRKTGGRRS